MKHTPSERPEPRPEPHTPTAAITRRQMLGAVGAASATGMVIGGATSPRHADGTERITRAALGGIAGATLAASLFEGLSAFDRANAARIRANADNPFAHCRSEQLLICLTLNDVLGLDETDRQLAAARIAEKQRFPDLGALDIQTLAIYHVQLTMLRGRFADDVPMQELLDHEHPYHMLSEYAATQPPARGR